MCIGINSSTFRSWGKVSIEKRLLWWLFQPYFALHSLVVVELLIYINWFGDLNFIEKSSSFSLIDCTKKNWVKLCWCFAKFIYQFLGYWSVETVESFHFLLVGNYSSISVIRTCTCVLLILYRFAINFRICFPIQLSVNHFCSVWRTVMYGAYLLITLSSNNRGNSYRFYWCLFVRLWEEDQSFLYCSTILKVKVCVYSFAFLYFLIKFSIWQVILRLPDMIIFSMLMAFLKKSGWLMVIDFW